MKFLKNLTTIFCITTLLITLPTINASAESNKNFDDFLNHQIGVFPELKEYFEENSNLELVSTKNIYYKFSLKDTAKSIDYGEENLNDYIFSEISKEEFENDNTLLKGSFKSSPPVDPDYTGDLNDSDSKLRLMLNVFRDPSNRSIFTVESSFVWKGRPVFAFTDALAISSSASLHPISNTERSEYAVHSSFTDAYGETHYTTDVYPNTITLDKDGVLAEVNIRQYGDYRAGHEGYLICKYIFNNPDLYSTGSLFGEYAHAKLAGGFSIEDGQLKPALPYMVYSSVKTDVSVHNSNSSLE